MQNLKNKGNKKNLCTEHGNIRGREAIGSWLGREWFETLLQKRWRHTDLWYSHGKM